MCIINTIAILVKRTGQTYPAWYILTSHFNKGVTMNSTFTPVIISALLTPNPAQVGSPVLISVAATDVEAIPSTVDYRSGELVSGEV